jgi:hypothetical protein
MSDDETKNDALVPHQAQFLTKRSAALVRRGLADALRLQSKLTPEEWQRVVERVQEYLNTIRALRNSAKGLDPDLRPSRSNRSDD